MDKPRVGLVLMRSGDLCCEEPGDVLGAVREDERGIVTQLNQRFEIFGPWIVDSVDTLQASQNALLENELDMVILAYQTESQEGALDALLAAIGARPLVIWCYLPWRRLPRPTTFNELQRTSGLIGTFAALGVLRNQGSAFFFTFGAPDDPRLLRDLEVAGRAARLRQQLRQTRIGLLPSPAYQTPLVDQAALRQQASSIFVDERRLAAELGPVVERLTVGAYRKAAGEVSSAQVRGYVQELRSRFPVEGIGEETLTRAGRATLALQQLARQHRLDVLALNDTSPELLQVFNMRPALYPDLSGAGPVLYQPEGDLGAAVANYILNRLTGSPTMFLELFFWDEALNQLVGGHGGLQDPANADPREAVVGRDYGCCPADGREGALLDFLARAGRVTLLQLRSTPAGWQAMALSGVCLEGQPWVEGLPHAILRLDATVEHFMNVAAEVGVTQHWIMAYGSVLHEIEAFFKMEKIPVEILSY